MERYLGSEKVEALPIFHTLTGSFKVSCFAAQGKWINVKCEKLSVDPDTQWYRRCFGSYWCWCYAHDRMFPHPALWKSTTTDIDKARRKHFAKKSNDPLVQPTRAALEQHIRRAIYQGGHIWFKTLVLSPALPSPIDSRWIKTSNMYELHWITFREHSSSGGNLSPGIVRRAGSRSTSTRSPVRYGQQRVLGPENALRTGLAKLRWRFRTVQERTQILLNVDLSAYYF